MRVPSGQVTGLIITGIAVLANALSSILGRHINRSGAIEPTAVTVVSMGISAMVLFVGGGTVQGPPQLTLAGRADPQKGMRRQHRLS